MPNGAKHMKEHVLAGLADRVQLWTANKASVPLYINGLREATANVPDDDDLEVVYASATHFAFWESWSKLDYHPEGIITVHYDVDGVTYTASFTKLG
jgi:hypothetical protein